MSQKGFAPILIVLILAALVGGYLVYTNYSNNRTKILPTPTQVACTQDAQLCPDGTSVGRVGPKCEFSPCPTHESTSSTDTSTLKKIKEVTQKEIQWSEIKRSELYDGVHNGYVIEGIQDANNSYRIDIPDDIKREDWQADLSSEAGSPGGNAWGYKRAENGKQRLLLFKTQSDFQYNKYPTKVTVFLSDSF